MKIKELFENAYSAGVSDGMRGERDPRASAKYGPEMDQYTKGFQAGLEQDKKTRQERVQKKDTEEAPYKEMSVDELKQQFSDLRKKQAEHIQALRNLYGNRSYREMKKIDPDFDKKLQKLQDKFGDMKEVNDKIEIINRVLYQKGVRESATEEPTIDEGTRYWKGYEKKGMKTMFGKRVPNCVKKESIEVDNEGAIAIVNFKKKFDWDKVSNLADNFDVGMDVLDNNTTHGEPGIYYLQADFYDDIDNFAEILYFRYDDELISIDELTEDLKKWFGKGKKGGAGGGGWDAYNSKGERIGKCGETSGRAKPKCLSKSKAASLRNSDANDDGKKDGKAGIARAVKRKRRKDPNPDRKGKAKNVKNKE